MSSFFITGTDTGVGKTLIGGALARALAKRGKRVGVFKPVETGCRLEHGRPVPSDAFFLKEMSGSPEDISRICPYRLQQPLAPWVAAELENTTIDIERIVSLFLEMRQTYDVVLVEGAGGLMVPLTGELMTVDMVRDLAIPVVVVARLSLGTINHTLLTVKQCLAGGLQVAGIVLNQLSVETGKAEETNPRVIETFSPVPVLGRMPFVPRNKREDASYLANLVTESLDLTFLG